MSLDLIEEYRVTSSYRLGILIPYMCVHSGINDGIMFRHRQSGVPLCFYISGQGKIYIYVLTYIIICTRFYSFTYRWLHFGTGI
jgi:hypothetical protein